MNASEAAGQQGQMRSTLDAGLEQLSQDQTVTFTRYQKIVLAQDGFVFWVATPQRITARGSLHIAVDRQQDEDQTIGANQVMFTAESEITEFNVIAPDTLWIGSWPQNPLQIAFSQRAALYRESELWHYSGYAVYPALSAQLIASVDDLPAGPIVTNSLPIWLVLNQFAPVYPSFAVPDNIVPPYIAAHIEPGGTDALAAFPAYQWPGVTEPNSGASPLHDLPSLQLARDRVTLILYGFNNQTALQYLAYLIDSSLQDDAMFGFGNSPVIRDEKRIQREIAAIAQKKTIEIDANYLQGAADVVARRLILSALLNLEYSFTPVIA